MNSRYTKHVATILTFVFMAILYSDVLKKLALDWWNDPNYSHGFFDSFYQRLLDMGATQVLARRTDRHICLGTACPVCIWNIIHSRPHNRRAFYSALIVCDNVGWIDANLERQGPVAGFMGAYFVPGVHDPSAIYCIQ